MELITHFNHPNTELSTIPIDYRPAFLSLIKAAIHQMDDSFFRLYYEQNRLKPFTFSVQLGEKCKIEGNFITFTPPLLFKFRTADLRWVIALHNYFLQKPEIKFSAGVHFIPEQSRYYPSHKIFEENVTFKTISPIFVRSLADRNHGILPVCDNFPGDAEFNVAFKESIRGQARDLIAKEIDSSSIEFTPIHLKKRIVKHMQDKLSHQPMKLPCFTGVFKLKAPIEIMNLIYQTGLGSRRSQGFGMVEVVKGS